MKHVANWALNVASVRDASYADARVIAQRSSHRLDGGKRVVQLVTQDANQAPPGASFLLAQGAGQVGEHD